MNGYNYVIDVSKLASGDIWELAECLLDFDPDELTIDVIVQDIHFAFHGDELDKNAVEDFLRGCTDIKWDCEDY